MMRNIVKKLLFVLLLTTPLAALAGNTELTWYGHAAFKLTTPSGKVLLIDPWITNPANKNGKEDLAKIDKADLILISHGHSDHVGNSVAIAKATGAQLVATYDLGNSLVQNAGFPAAQATMMTEGNFGGELTLLNGEVKIAFIPAVHSSAVTDAEKKNHDGGNPGGFLISVKNGPTIYHTGDTDVFSDMALIKQFHKVDVMLACIGGHFTMGPERAAMAVKLVGAKTVIPMHFGTFPILNGTPEELAKALKAEGSKAKVKTMTIGETIKL
ncbi:MAG: metal-dependent hydrolase [Gallionellaceae bacterium]|jgi:L-ascorbate metabolism protein UlaG (beta-lactamase superfamily)